VLPSGNTTRYTGYNIEISKPYKYNIENSIGYCLESENFKFTGILEG
jgi:hypothetical protein